MTLVLMIAGEPSGDLHASNVARKLREKSPQIRMIGMGGDQMKSAGVELIFHIRDSAVMGIGEVFTAIPKFLKKRSRLKSIIRREKPNAIVLIDFGDFNISLAKFSYRLGIPTIYYIPPKAWAWRGGRAKKIAKCTHAVASIFPFEADFYRDAGANVHFVGHPLIDLAKTDLTKSDARKFLELDPDRQVIGLMPGSRRREIENLLPIMIETAQNLRRSFPDLQFILPLATNLSDDVLPNLSFVKVMRDQVYSVIKASTAMIVASGTATLETALIGTPMVIIYKVSPLTWWVAQNFVNLDRSGLPNIIADREIVPELLQNEISADRITEIISELLISEEKRSEQMREFEKIRDGLGTHGAAEKVADLILDRLKID